MNELSKRSQRLYAFVCTFTKSARAKDRRGVDLISDPLPFGRLWYGDTNAVANAIGYATLQSLALGVTSLVLGDCQQSRLVIHLA